MEKNAPQKLRLKNSERIMISFINISSIRNKQESTLANNFINH